MHVWTLFQGGWGALPLGNYSPTFLLLSTLRVITSGMFFSLTLPLPSRVRVTSSGKHALTRSSLYRAQGSSFVEVPTLHKDLTCVFPLDVPLHAGRRGARLCRAGLLLGTVPCTQVHVLLSVYGSDRMNPVARSMKTDKHKQRKEELGIPGPKGPYLERTVTRGGCHRLS